MGLFKKTYWVTPNAHIIPNRESESTGQIYTGEYLAEFITSIGYPCSLATFTVGASVATYHFNLINITQVNKVKNAIPALEAKLHINAILDKSNIGHFSITLPRPERQTVHLKTAMLTKCFDELDGIPACLGTDAQGDTLAFDISTLPHMIISGTTGSGKSVLVNSIITSILFRKAPASVNFILIDPKETEFSMFSGLPHLMKPVITDAKAAVTQLSELCTLMDERYAQLRKLKKRDISGTNIVPIVVVVDELADLMMVSKNTEESSIVRIAQKGRAAGIHLILATQSPRAAVLTGLIRANLPTRIALRCTTAIDSRIALGHNGAEKLLNKGDGIICGIPGDIREYRFQAAWISPEDIKLVIDYWKNKKLSTFKK